MTDFRPDLLFMAVTAPGQLLTLSAGDNILDLYGFDPTGLDYLDFVEPSRCDLVYQNFRRLLEDVCGMHSIAVQHFPDGRILKSEALILPLSAGNADLVIFKCLLEDMSDQFESPYPVERNVPLSVDFFDLWGGADGPKGRSG